MERRGQSAYNHQFTQQSNYSHSLVTKFASHNRYRAANRFAQLFRQSRAKNSPPRRRSNHCSTSAKAMYTPGAIYMAQEKERRRGIGGSIPLRDRRSEINSEAAGEAATAAS